jgi:hypothetical protein
VPTGEIQLWADKLRGRLSATRFNNTLGTLKRAFDCAIAAGELHRNPAQDIARSYKPPKPTYTPTNEDFEKLIAAIGGSRSRLARDIVDFVRFLGYVGSRKTDRLCSRGAISIWSAAPRLSGTPRIKRFGPSISSSKRFNSCGKLRRGEAIHRARSAFSE